MMTDGSDSVKVNWIWVALTILITAWVLWLIWPQGPQQLTIPYSIFLREVRAGKVERVQIVGDRISGEFTSPAPATLATPSAQEAGPDVRTFTQFTTTYPEAVGDPQLLPLLEQHGVVVDTAPVSDSWLLPLLSLAFPFLLLGLVLYLSRRRVGPGMSQSGMFDFMKSRARRYVDTQSRVTFDSIAGADEAKENLQQVVDFLKNPSRYHDLGARIPRGVLLVGPPGTGKTLMARAVAGEANVPFYNINASEFVQMFVGVGAGRVRDLFEKAKEAAPSIVFIDELDAVGRRRGAGVGNTNDEREQTLNQLLSEMDGFEARQEVIVMAATNRPDVLDPALLRPGRFDRQVTLGLPDRKGREDILRIHVRPLPLADDVDLELLARSTTGMSGADLANLANEAALIAARNRENRVTARDFAEALDTIQLGEVRSLMLDERQRRLIAYHEAGHALVAWMLPGTDPVQKVTIIPRGRALGVTHQVPEEDQYNLSRTYLLNRLAVMLGGRAAEEVALNDLTTGAENDLAQASALARRMVTRWGMSELGPISVETDETQPFLGYELTQGRTYSEDTARLIDREIHRLLEDGHARARAILTRERDDLDRMVEALLEEETISITRLTEILGPRAAAAPDTHQPTEREVAPQPTPQPAPGVA
ncbi:MAG: ATP-dependent zinc metalloprotease FtsH [Anaerolineae bacterium]|nr:ATP-dependent zinc metalloprotease FtsH [Anaerolineae bacterium]